MHNTLSRTVSATELHHHKGHYLAAMAFNLTRAAGVLASTFHAKARTATIRAQLINIPARIANRARSWLLHLPRNWPWQPAWDTLFAALNDPVPLAA